MKKPEPPKFANRLLECFCAPSLLEEIQGDLYELYGKWVNKYGAAKANWLFLFHAIKFIRPFAIRRLPGLSDFKNVFMLRNYLVMATRNMFRRKLITSINLFGLALGMSICLIILMLLKDLKEYDTFHPYPARTVRVTTKINTTGGLVHQARTPLVLGNTLKNNYTFIDDVVRIYPADEIHLPEVKFNEKVLSDYGAFADASFFHVFGFELNLGNVKKALAEPFTVILTAETAYKFFGKENPIGEVVTIGSLGDFRVTGVMAKPPRKSHLNFAFYASMATVPILENAGKMGNKLVSWNEVDAAYTYALLKAPSQKESLSGILDNLSANAMKNFKSRGTATGYTFGIQPIEEIMPTRLFYETMTGMSWQGLIIYSCLALAILLIAGFNYINLSIACSLSRAKEVGIRKVSGATQIHIFSQFIAESVLTALVALAIALVFFRYIPLSNKLANDVAAIDLDLKLMIWFVLFSVALGLFAGSIPAWLFSKINATKALKNLSGLKIFKGFTWQKGLIVFQLSISLVFVVCFLVLFQQSRYEATADYGFNKENILSISLQDADYNLLRTKLEAHTNVEQIAVTSDNFGFSLGYDCDMQKHRKEEPVRVSYFAVDHNIIPMMGLKLLAGQNFSEGLSSSSKPFVILNEKAMEVLSLGTPETAVGQEVWLSDSIPVQVIGIIQNFRFHAFSKIPNLPMVLQYKPEAFHYMDIKVKDPQSASFISYLEESWQQVHTQKPISCYNYSEKFSEQLSNWDDVVRISFFTIMALFIACLGLLGVVMYAMETRVKEIGIRKIVGAGVLKIVFLLSRDFLKLILIAVAIALPIAYWLGNMMLRGYIYKISIGVELLSLGLFIILIISLLVIASQTIKAALANPVDSLRNE